MGDVIELGRASTQKHSYPDRMKLEDAHIIDPAHDPELKALGRRYFSLRYRNTPPRVGESWLASCYPPVLFQNTPADYTKTDASDAFTKNPTSKPIALLVTAGWAHNRFVTKDDLVNATPYEADIVSCLIDYCVKHNAIETRHRIQCRLYVPTRLFFYRWLELVEWMSSFYMGMPPYMAQSKSMQFRNNWVDINKPMPRTTGNANSSGKFGAEIND